MMTLEAGGQQQHAPALADHVRAGLRGEPDVVPAAAGAGDGEQVRAGLEHVGIEALGQAAVLRHTAGRDDDRARAHVRVIYPDAMHTALVGQQSLDPGREHDLGTADPSRSVEHRDQPRAFAFGHVTAPDVLHPGLGQPGHVGAGRP